MVTTPLAPFRVQPDYRHRVWGGHRLHPEGATVGEAWAMYEGSTIVDGPWANARLADVALGTRQELLGRRVVARTGLRFPLLLKLLDAADWLSVQVHPDDDQAAAMEGSAHWGKAEAWHVIDALPGAEVIAGVREGTTPDALASAIRSGTVLTLLRREQVRAGDSMMVAPGTIHAVGPGLLLYEVQQSSDLTYRVFDWGRPVADGRELHVDQSVAVARAGLAAVPTPAALAGSDAPERVIACEHFVVDRLRPGHAPVRLHTANETFHALTATVGSAEVVGDGWAETIQMLETVLVPAATGPYEVRSMDAAGEVLVASVP